MKQYEGRKVTRVVKVIVKKNGPRLLGGTELQELFGRLLPSLHFVGEITILYQVKPLVNFLDISSFTTATNCTLQICRASRVPQKELPSTQYSLR